MSSDRRVINMLVCQTGVVGFSDQGDSDVTPWGSARNGAPVTVSRSADRIARFTPEVFL